MYTLYYLNSACSLAIHTVLRELDQSVELIDITQVSNFTDINPVGSVPVLVDGDNTLREGGAILLHLLNKHRNQMLPTSGASREQAIQDILFANATMHPAYGRLYFIAEHITDTAAREAAYLAAANAINRLWQVVEQQLAGRDFLGGEQASAADIMLAVYFRWGAGHPVSITQGSNTTRMLDAVMAMPSFQRSVLAENTQSAA